MLPDLEPNLSRLADILTENEPHAYASGESIITTFSELGYPEVRRYDHALRNYANIGHEAFIKIVHPGITHPFQRTEPRHLRSKRHFPEKYFLRIRDEYDLAFELTDLLLLTQAKRKRAVFNLGDGYYLACAALPLKHALAKGESGQYLDLCQLFPDDRQKTFITFTLGGWWHDSQTNEVLISVPLRQPTREYPYKYEWQKPTSEYDGRLFRYFYLHEKVHQYLALNGAANENTDANCNAAAFQIVQKIETAFPHEKFLTGQEFLSWAQWQKATSGQYSE